MEQNKEFETAYQHIMTCFDMLNETGSLSTTIEVVDGMEKKYVIKFLELIMEVGKTYKSELTTYKNERK